MRTFNSLEDLAKEVYRKDLEKQLTLEKMKLNVNSLKHRLTREVIPGEIAHMAGNYLGKVIRNNFKNK